MDNLVHSFALQLDNGLPILNFENDVGDKELQHVEKLLMRAKEHLDVRTFFSEHFGLKAILGQARTAKN